jgi:hypothetical protein
MKSGGYGVPLENNLPGLVAALRERLGPNHPMPSAVNVSVQ